MPVLSISLVILLILVVLMGAKVVPQQTAYIVERLGKYHSTMSPGLNIIIPFVDRIAYKHTLKEVAADIPEQVCITKDNVQVAVDGVVFYQVMEPKLASYGISNFMFAVSQLSQTTMRSEIGKIVLDKCFEERGNINVAVVAAIDEAAAGWGVKVLRYEIKNITPPQTVLMAMEKQMQAEREKRATILYSEGEKQSAVNVAEGQKEKVVLESEALRQQQINQAEGQAAAIISVADATAEGIKKIADAIQSPGGMEAVQLRVAENLVEQYGKLAKTTNTMILPANFADMGSMISAAMSVIKSNGSVGSNPTAPGKTAK
jgi:regulator of protease activity HflC (stomatin/prohibitin superfamily)